MYREYERTIETESGPVKVPWPITEIVIDSITVLDRKNKQEKQGPDKAPLRSEVASMRQRSVYSVESLCGLHI